MRLSSERPVVILRGDNYPEWATNIKLILREKILWKVFDQNVMVLKDGEIVDSQTYKERIKLCEDKNEVAMAKIGLSIDVKLQNAVANCETAYEMWNKLKNMFDNNSDTRLVALRTEMMKLKCSKDENILQYFCT